MIVRKYYIKEIVELNVIDMKAGCNPVFVRDTFGFFCSVIHYQTYHPMRNDEVFKLPKDTFLYYQKNGLDVLKEIDLNDVGQHYVGSVLRNFNQRGIKHFAKLDIWNNDFLKRYNLHNPQSLSDKIVML